MKQMAHFPLYIFNILESRWDGNGFHLKHATRICKVTHLWRKMERNNTK